MSRTGLTSFDRALQKTHEWLNAVMRELGTDDRHKAYLALRAVLHALRDHLPTDEVAQFGAQLPLLLRGVYYDGWRPGHVLVKERSKDEFLEHVRSTMAAEPGRHAEDDPEAVARAVFTVVADQMTEGQTGKVVNLLPKALRELWPMAPF